MRNARDLKALVAALDRHVTLTVAVSGGVDSMVLSYVAHRFSSVAVTMAHAISPAVPKSATARIRDYAAREGWNVRFLDAGEFADPSYRANPVNRCYFCKSNLYARIRSSTHGAIASGTNVDDLGDFRPGLRAAEEREIVHPYVEAGVAKAGIYGLAERHGLDDLAELPAQPCLASRVETGISIDAGDLAFVERVESAAAALAPAKTDIRCRITRAGAVLEVGDAFPDHRRAELASLVSALCLADDRPFAGLRSYRRGSAFIRAVGSETD
jgi:uncharacterized protein